MEERFQTKINIENGRKVQNQNFTVIEANCPLVAADLFSGWTLSAIVSSLLFSSLLFSKDFFLFLFLLCLIFLHLYRYLSVSLSDLVLLSSCFFFVLIFCFFHFNFLLFTTCLNVFKSYQFSFLTLIFISSRLPIRSSFLSFSLLLTPHTPRQSSRRSKWLI